MLSTRLIQPARRWRIHRKELLVGSSILLVLIGLFTAAYFLSANRYEWNRNPNAQTDFTLPQMGPAIMAGDPIPAQEKAVIVGDPLGDSTPTPLPVPSDLTETVPENEMVEIYSAVTRQLYTVDHTFGDSAPNWPKVFLVNTTDDRVGDPNIPQSDPGSIPLAMQEEITSQLVDLPAQILWVASQDEVPTSPKDGSVENGKGVVITIGNIHPQKDGSVQVSASLFFSSLGAAGKTYILTKVDGVWQVTGSTGVEWIS